MRGLPYTVVLPYSCQPTLEAWAGGKLRRRTAVRGVVSGIRGAVFGHFHPRICIQESSSQVTGHIYMRTCIYARRCVGIYTTTGIPYRYRVSQSC